MESGYDYDYEYIYIYIYIHIYYYTALPLNLANKQEASNKQLLLLSVLVIAWCPRFGLYSTPASREPRWWSYEIQVLGQKLTVGAPRAGAPSLEVPSKNCAFFGPKQVFLARNGPETQSKRANDGKLLLHSTCALIVLLHRSPFLPSSSTICSRNGPKMAKNGQNVRYLCPTRPKPRTGRILGYVAQNQVHSAPSPPAIPQSLWFPLPRITQRYPYIAESMVTSCSQRAAQPAHSWGQR